MLVFVRLWVSLKISGFLVFVASEWFVLNRVLIKKLLYLLLSPDSFRFIEGTVDCPLNGDRLMLPLEEYLI